MEASERGVPAYVVPAAVGAACVALVACTLSALRLLALDAAPPRHLWDVYDQQLRLAKYVDLTHAIEPDVPLWRGFEQPAFAAAPESATQEPFTYARSGFVATAYALMTDQLGTHLDPPAHWNEFGATISDVPPTVSLRPLVVIDVTERPPGYHATVTDLMGWEASHSRIPEGAVVVFRSDWSRSWARYARKGKVPDVFPGVSLPALRFLHQNRSILMHGHEPLDVDMSSQLEGEAWLMHNNYMQLEGLTNLHLLPSAGALVSIGFARFQGGTGGLARVVAICPPSWPHGVTIMEMPGAPLPEYADPLRRDANGVLRPTPGATPTAYCADTSRGGGPLGCPLPHRQ